ncbi:cache domain-containing protein [uncultured Methanospirillum sp.]|uniref:cache domain-containing protein n=1 Tax=uncultured Methanospirillum sp. TaxID=262503 RepID=UPI0029C82197|nr:cache domain-containing protein [uncultured Methanospirillum sp.]
MRNTPVPFLAVLILCLVLGTAGHVHSQSQIPASTPDATNPPVQEEYTSNETLVTFVENAVTYAKTHGREAALAEFSNPNGSFVKGELYIYAYDFNCTTLAHPFNPEKIGKNRLGESDAYGNPYTQQFLDAARNGSGSVRFYYLNPAHNRTIESKLGYVQRVDEDWWLGSGIYTGPADRV